MLETGGGTISPSSVQSNNNEIAFRDLKTSQIKMLHLLYLFWKKRNLRVKRTSCGFKWGGMCQTNCEVTSHYVARQQTVELFL